MFSTKELRFSVKVLVWYDFKVGKEKSAFL